ncbi:MAG: glycosyltransferase [Halioglobus sp.]|nr:glycosyltransferase [Halioglobus sp.]
MADSAGAPRFTEIPKKRILFVAEAVTLAHVARPAALARGLADADYDVHLAQHPRYRQLQGEVPATEHAIESITPQAFNAALSQGAPLYDLATLKSYVEAERELIARIRPDIVVGDFRITLAVSAALAGVPCVTIGNACWSPYVRQHYVAPDLPVTRRFGPVLGQALFSLARPLAFAAHCLPMRALRRHYGLASLGFDLARVYTHGDYTLYADLPSLYRTRPLPEHHRFIGPVLFSPAGPLPDWWNTLPEDKRAVYVTPGSSGSAALLPAILEALGGLDVAVMLATAGADIVTPVADNISVAAFLPGDAAAARADLVICNGGSPTTHQALACGRPVLGIAGNMDQFLNMQTLTRAGAGACLRADVLTPRRLRDAVTRMLETRRFADRAVELQRQIDDCDGVANFRAVIDAITM